MIGVYYILFNLKHYFSDKIANSFAIVLDKFWLNISLVFSKPFLINYLPLSLFFKLLTYFAGLKLIIHIADYI